MTKNSKTHQTTIPAGGTGRTDINKPSDAGPVHNEMLDDFLLLPPRIEVALREIIAYLWDDEQKDFEATPKRQREGHVFGHVFRLRAWTACPTGRLRLIVPANSEGKSDVTS